MTKRIIWIWALTLALALTASAQVSFEARLDSVYLLIGQQRQLTLDVTCGSSQQVTMPDLKPDMVLQGVVEIVDYLGCDTTVLDEGRQKQIQARWTITAWDSALVYLPPFEAEVDGKAYQSQSLALKVITMDVDTLHTDMFFPPNTEVENNPFAWSDWKPVIVYSVVLLVLLLLLSYVYIRYKQNKPLIFIRRRVVKLPPHQVAMAEINRIKSEKKWAEEDSKEYYTMLTDALRKYIKERYGFNATEMTSTEIIEHLLQEHNEQALAELRELFQTADLVKFAKWTTLINENDMNLVNAIDFINQTKIEVDPNAEPEPEEIPDDVLRSRKRSHAMVATLIVLSTVAVAVLGYIIWVLVDVLR